MNYKIESFINNCDPVDIEYLIDWVKDANMITQRDFLDRDMRDMSIGERLFEDQLDKLHGKWNQLTKEEEEFIYRIAKRF